MRIKTNAKNSTRLLLFFYLCLCSLDLMLRFDLFRLLLLCLFSWHSCRTSPDTPMRRGSRNDIDPVTEYKGNILDIFSLGIAVSLTSVCTMAGRWERRIRTVWNTSSTPSYCMRSSTMLSVMKTPVRPTPAEQCTVMGPSCPNCSLVLCTWPMKSIKPSPDLGTPCSGQSMNWNWRTVREEPSRASVTYEESKGR